MKQFCKTEIYLALPSSVGSYPFYFNPFSSYNKVVCIDVSREENAVNRELSAAAGLTDKIIIPGERSYFETGLPANSIDAVVSQDSLLHAGTEQYRALKEASRVLKPGALMAFTDLMQSETADPKKLHEVML